MPRLSRIVLSLVVLVGLGLLGEYKAGGGGRPLGLVSHFTPIILEMVDYQLDKVIDTAYTLQQKAGLVAQSDDDSQEGNVKVFEEAEKTSIYSLDHVQEAKVVDVMGEPYDLAQQHKGRVLLTFNAASHCGLTESGYLQAVELYNKYHSQGLDVVAWPCNQFGEQEPGTGSEIRDYAAHYFKVNFPILNKVNVNGPEAHPVWEVLKQGAPGVLGSNSVLWNFQMFLVDREGIPQQRFNPGASTKEVEAAIQKLLAE